MSILKTKPKNVGHYEMGGFIVDFYTHDSDPAKCFATINTVSKNFSLRITGYPYGYLMASVKDGDTENLHGFCVLMYLIADGVYQDSGLANDLMKVIGKYQKRLMKQAESNAAKITAEQDMADTELMRDIISEQGLSKRELKEKREADKQAMRDALNDKE